MCIFRTPPPAPVGPPPQVIQPRNPDVVQASRLPTKKELLDPDDLAGVEYGSEGKTKGNEAGKKRGTDALKIKLNTGAQQGASTGGVQTP
tara:strand:+ start:227 stop:496 length:270 start_codon:yes stop_codon:yes gene_type:complete